MAEKISIFHARVGRFEDSKTLVFGDVIDLPYATDQFSLLDLSEGEIINLHIPIVAGLWALPIAGMDDSGIIIYQDMGTNGARFERPSISWSQTPKYLVFDDGEKADKKLILEITHDSQIQVDIQNTNYRRENPAKVNPSPVKTRIIPLSEWSPGSTE